MVRVLAIAGSDSGGGAGIQADIKTITALGAFATSAISAITAQNTLGVTAVSNISPEMVVAQIRAVLEDIGTDAIKTGMLSDVDVIDAVAQSIAAFSGPLVVDPVMVATSGAKLSTDQSVQRLVEKLFPRAMLVTPNLPEAEILWGQKISGPEDMLAAARAILKLGPDAVLLKGGHLPGANLIDLLVTPQTIHRFESAKIETVNTHGTGCTLASAIATGLAQGMDMIPAVERARAYLRRAIELAPGFGSGHGPVNHGYPFQDI